MAKALRSRPNLRRLFTKEYGKDCVSILESGAAGNLLKNKWQSMAKAFKDGTQAAPAQESPRYLWDKYTVQKMYLTHTQSLATKQLQAKLQKQQAKIAAGRQREQARRQTQNFRGRGVPAAEFQDLCSSSDEEDGGGGISDGDGDGDGGGPEAAAGKENAGPRKGKEAKKGHKKPHVAAQAAPDAKLGKSLDSMAQNFKGQTAVHERGLEQDLRLHTQALEQKDRHQADKLADKVAERRELAEDKQKDRDHQLELQARDHAHARDKQQQQQQQQQHEEKMMLYKIELAKIENTKARKGDSQEED